jgi:hypothetical protein
VRLTRLFVALPLALAVGPRHGAERVVADEDVVEDGLAALG